MGTITSHCPSDRGSNTEDPNSTHPIAHTGKSAIELRNQMNELPEYVARNLALPPSDRCL